MLGLIIIVLALALAPAVSQFTTSAMNASSGDVIGLDCDNVSIDNFMKATCVATDMTLFYFIGILIAIAGAVVTAKFFFGGTA